MTDMTRHLKRWLTDKALAEMGGEFEGVIAAVSEEPIRNRFTAQRSIEPVVTFQEGGYRLVLNKTILQALINWFGPESDDWLGRRVRIFRRHVETTNQQGQTRTRWQRAIACEDPHARVAIRGAWPRATGSRDGDAVREREPCEGNDVPARVTEHKEDFSDAIGAHDEDDIEAEARPRTARRHG